MKQARYGLVVVPCGKRKVWNKDATTGPTMAKDAYIGAPFKVNREYAEKFSDVWVILSAKYGFIKPEYEIPWNYNVTFTDLSTNPVTIEKLREQVKQNFTHYDKVVALGSTTYSNIVKEAFNITGAVVCSPVSGLPIGKALAAVKTAIKRNQPFEC